MMAPWLVKLLFPVAAALTPHPFIWTNPPPRALATLAAQSVGVSPRLVWAVMWTESGGNFHGAVTRVSAAGAIGLMQLEPATARALGVNPWSAWQNAVGGARYLQQLIQRFGSVTVALEAYNAGPTRVARGSVPLAARQYAATVLRRAGGSHGV